MGQFTLTFATNSDAFHENPDAEIARIVKEAAAKIACGGNVGGVNRLRDANGQRVGFFYHDTPEDWG